MLHVCKCVFSVCVLKKQIVVSKNKSWLACTALCCDYSAATTLPRLLCRCGAEERRGAGAVPRPARMRRLFATAVSQGKEEQRTGNCRAAETRGACGGRHRPSCADPPVRARALGRRAGPAMGTAKTRPKSTAMRRARGQQGGCGRTESAGPTRCLKFAAGELHPQSNKPVQARRSLRHPRRNDHQIWHQHLCGRVPYKASRIAFAVSPCGSMGSAGASGSHTGASSDPASPDKTIASVMLRRWEAERGATKSPSRQPWRCRMRSMLGVNGR